MLSKTSYNIKKLEFDWKKEVSFTTYCQTEITKKFLTETFLKAIVSIIKNRGEVEYDNRNWLRHQKTQFAENSEVKVTSHCLFT